MIPNLETSLSGRQLGAYQREGERFCLIKDRDRIGADLVNLFKGTALTLGEKKPLILEGGCILFRRGNISYNASQE